MKAIDIAIKDLKRSFRSAAGLVFMFGIPLLVTGMFSLMFGSAVNNERFELPRIRVVVANLDHHGPRLQAGRHSLPEGIHANTISELVVSVLESKDFAELLSVSHAANVDDARMQVDERQADAAVIIPPDFSKQFADPNGQAAVELYVDPTLTIGPGVLRAILGRFMDSIAGIKIAVDQTLDTIDQSGMDPALAGRVIQRFTDSSRTQSSDLSEEFLEIHSPAGAAPVNPVLAIVGPIMAGMMIFYAYYTGVSTAQSILREDEERTLPRMFTTPTSRAEILTGKFLAVFLTVLAQVVTLIIAARLLFGINWGGPISTGMAAAGIILSASTFGIFINSLLKDTRQGGMIFGGVLTVTGMVGMIRIFAMNAPGAARISDTVGLLVPQGWAVRGMLAAMDGRTALETAPNLLVMLAWSTAFFLLGVWRFHKRYG